MQRCNNCEDKINRIDQIGHELSDILQEEVEALECAASHLLELRQSNKHKELKECEEFIEETTTHLRHVVGNLYNLINNIENALDKFEKKN